MFPVKENRQALFDALNALPWAQVPVACTATDKGDGRITTRTIQILPAPDDLPFPHVSQVFLIERYVTDLHRPPVSAVVALASPARNPELANAADLAGYVRNSGRSSLFTGCATLSIKRTNPTSEPVPGPRSWLLSATSQSGHSAWPDAPTSPKPPDGPDVPWTAHSPSSDSHHDLGTAVTRNSRPPRRSTGFLMRHRARLCTRYSLVNLYQATVSHADRLAEPPSHRSRRFPLVRLRSGWGDVSNQVGFPISPGSEQVLEVPGDRKIRQLRISFIIPATQDIRI